MELHCMGSHASPISSLRQTTFNSDIEGLGSQAALTSSAIQLLLLAFATLPQEFTVIHGRNAPKLAVTPSAAPALITSANGTSETSRRDPVKSAYEVKAVVQRTSSEDRF
jgi:hypothetical protein